MSYKHLGPTWDLLGEIYAEDRSLYVLRCEELLWCRRRKRAFQGGRHPYWLEL